MIAETPRYRFPESPANGINGHARRRADPWAGRPTIEAAAFQLLAELIRAGVAAPDDEPAEAKAVHAAGGLTVVVRVQRYDAEADLPAALRAVVSNVRTRMLTPCQQRILSACREGDPLTTRAIARRLGREANSYFRAQLAALVRLRLVVPHDGGYVLAPEAAGRR